MSSSGITIIAHTKTSEFVDNTPQQLMKNIYVLQLSPDYMSEFMTVLWPSAKTYYERHGSRPDEFNWVNPSIELLPDLELIKEQIKKNPPDIFGVSLYVWNFERVLPLCKWVKSTYPNCLIITGGPHQYFKHDTNWFQQYSFIDASLPSDVYGEIAICDLLDNLKDDNTVNWNTVEQMVYPSRSRQQILKSIKSTYKRSFDWNYSIYQSQSDHIKKYVDDYYSIKQSKLFVKLETTRGCPYKCTFCDWGGGVGGKMLLKDVEYIYQDLDFLVTLDIGGIYICDSNFGINRDRDVGIIQYIADKKKQSDNNNFTSIHYGGFAKTDKHIDTIKKILTIEGENQLSDYYKISQQSFHKHILNNVKREDLRFEQHFELAEYVKESFNYSVHVELIMGLPGITVDLWLEEFDIPWQYNVIARAYEWYLLPESESYGQAYRQEYGILTAKKIFSTDDYAMPVEIVVGGNTFSREDYQTMMIAYMWYLFFAQGGAYRLTITNILKQQDIQFSDFLKKFLNECYPLIAPYCNELISELKSYTNDEFNRVFTSNISIGRTEIPIRYYFAMLFFNNFDAVSEPLESWLISIGGNKTTCLKDSQLIITETRAGSKTKKWPYQIDYKVTGKDAFVKQLVLAHTGDIVDIMVGTKSIKLF